MKRWNFSNRRKNFHRFIIWRVRYFIHEFEASLILVVFSLTFTNHVEIAFTFFSPHKLILDQKSKDLFAQMSPLKAQFLGLLFRSFKKLTAFCIGNCKPEESQLSKKTKIKELGKPLNLFLLLLLSFLHSWWKTPIIGLKNFLKPKLT